jgi:hypothetical protein
VIAFASLAPTWETATACARDSVARISTMAWSHPEQWASWLSSALRSSASASACRFRLSAVPPRVARSMRPLAVCGANSRSSRGSAASTCQQACGRIVGRIAHSPASSPRADRNAAA